MPYYCGQHYRFVCYNVLIIFDFSHISTLPRKTRAFTCFVKKPILRTKYNQNEKYYQQRTKIRISLESITWNSVGLHACMPLNYLHFLLLAYRHFPNKLFIFVETFKQFGLHFLSLLSFG